MLKRGVWIAALRKQPRGHERGSRRFAVQILLPFQKKRTLPHIPFFQRIIPRIAKRDPLVRIVVSRKRRLACEFLSRRTRGPGRERSLAYILVRARTGRTCLRLR